MKIRLEVVIALALLGICLGGGLTACGKKEEAAAPPPPVPAPDALPSQSEPAPAPLPAQVPEAPPAVPHAPVNQVHVLPVPHQPIQNGESAHIIVNPAILQHAQVPAQHAQPPSPQAHQAQMAMHKAPEPDLESYSVKVFANERLVIPGPGGELRVWIGLESNVPEDEASMASETKPLGGVGETARIEPYAEGIDVELQKDKCIKVDPGGSEVRFRLIPRGEGTFKVGANVELFSSPDCTGIAVPKTAKSVEVKVIVDKAGVAKQGAMGLLGTAWKAFQDFWGKLVILVFAVLLFLIRKKLFQWFGFKDKGQDA